MDSAQEVDSNQPCLGPEQDDREEADDNAPMNDGSRAEPPVSEMGKCTLGPGDQHEWKPITMRAPVLLFFAGVSVSLIICIEVLFQVGKRNGGLHLVYDRPEDLPTSIVFSYLYLPMVVAVIYRLLYVWIDLDVKRIFPWLQLSAPDGVKGKDSLFVNYESPFAKRVPFLAFRRRHWTMFFSGTITTLIALAITPLQSAILNTQLVSLRQQVPMSAPSRLRDPVAQAAVLNRTVVDYAYISMYYHRPPSAFTTANYALLPFYPPESVRDRVVKWTGVTTKYWTELRCWPAKITHPRPDSSSYASFDNGQGCSPYVTNTTSPRGPQGNIIRYIGPLILGCGQQFLAIRAFQGNGTRTNITAQFCEPSYHQQRVKAMIMAEGLVSVDDYLEPVGPVEPFSSAEFNSTAFHFLAERGKSIEDMPRDRYAFSIFPDPQKFGGEQHPLDSIQPPMGELAVGIAKGSPDDFSNAEFMTSAFQGAHQLLFSAAFRHLLEESTTSRSEVGEIEYLKFGIYVDRTFSAIVESALGVVTMLTLALWWRCHRSPSMLSGDPRTLGYLFSVVQNSPSLLKAFRNTGSLSGEDLAAALGDCHFRLVCGCQDPSGPSGKRVLVKLAGGSDESSSDLEHDQGQALSKTDRHLGKYPPVKPTYFRHLVGFAFGCLFAAALSILSYCCIRASATGGLALPSSSLFINKLLMNYIPTAFASNLAEPFWDELNYMMCLLQPFFDLLSDRGTARRTINARYAMIPPSFTVSRALKSGHWLLGLLCINAWLGGVLSVGLGALFHSRPAYRTEAFEMTRQPESAVANFEGYVNSSKVDAVAGSMQTLAFNLAYKLPTPPWMTREFAFLPVNLSSRVFEDDATFSMRTVGYGVETSCISLGSFLTENAMPVLDLSFVADGCPSNVPAPLLDPTFSFDGRIAAENITGYQMLPGPCRDYTIFAWARTNASTIHFGKGKDITGVGQINSSYALCHKPSVKTADFDIHFDSRGNILQAEIVENATSPNQHPNSTASLEGLVKNIMSFIRGGEWHTDSNPHGMFSYLLWFELGSNEFLNPAAPPPDPEKLLPAMTKTLKTIYALMVHGVQATLVSNENPLQETIAGSKTVYETRIFVSRPAFVASVVTLSIYLATVAVFYLSRPKFSLPRLPDSIGSQLSYIAASSFANRGADPKKLMEDMKGETFRFGTFLGPDGQEHIGIDSSDRVTPLDPNGLVKGGTRREMKKKMRKVSRFFARRGKSEEQDGMIPLKKPNRS